MKKIFIVSAFTLAFTFAAVSETYACSCFASPPDTPMSKVVTDAKNGADAVFVGKVISVRHAEGNSNAGTGTIYVKLAVIRSWKGVKTKEIEISTAANSAMCGVGFEVGKTFIVYANKSGDSMATNLCTRTQMIATKSDDEKFLGKPQKLVMKKAA